MDIINVQKAFGADMVRGPWCYKEQYDSTIRIEEKRVNGSIITRYLTPVGTLQKTETFTKESPNIPFPAEHLIKTAEDLETFNYLTEHTSCVPDYKELEDALKKNSNIVVATGIMSTAFEDMLAHHSGVEKFVYLYYDHTALIEETMAILKQKREREAAITAQGPAEVIICYENTNTANSSPEWIKQFEIPMLNDYARIMHDHGKKLLVHMCGHINMVVDQIAAALFDGIVDVAPPPTGDCDLPAAVRTLGAQGKVLTGGIECTMFAHLKPDALVSEVRSLVSSIPDTRCFFLGSGDAVPQGTSVENLNAIKALIEKPF